MADNYISTGAALKRLGISDSTLRRWRKAGHIKFLEPVTPNGKYRYDVDEMIARKLKENTQ